MTHLIGTKICIALAITASVSGCMKAAVVSAGSALVSGTAAVASGVASGASSAATAASSAAASAAVVDPISGEQLAQQQGKAKFAATSIEKTFGEGIDACFQSSANANIVRENLVSLGWNNIAAHEKIKRTANADDVAAEANTAKAAITEGTAAEVAEASAEDAIVEHPTSFSKDNVQAYILPGGGCSFRSGKVAVAQISSYLKNHAEERYDSGMTIGSPHGRSGACDGFRLSLPGQREAWVYFTSQKGKKCTREDGAGVNVKFL